MLLLPPRIALIQQVQAVHANDVPPSECTGNGIPFWRRCGHWRQHVDEILTLDYLENTRRKSVVS